MSGAGPQILVVDDDDEIRSLLQVVLTREGFRVQQAKDAPTARRMLGPQGSVGLIILDIMMPGEDGLSFCQRLSETLDVPILMISARGLSIDRSIGLELGADDYLPKPFERRELVARVTAILRRGGSSNRESRLRMGGLLVDLGERALRDAHDMPLPLTSGEFELLRCFVDRPGRVLSRDHPLKNSEAVELFSIVADEVEAARMAGGDVTLERDGAVPFFVAGDRAALS